MSTPTYDSATDISTLQVAVRNLNAILHQFNNSEGALSAKDEATLQAAINIGQTISTQVEVMHAFVPSNPQSRAGDYDYQRYGGNLRHDEAEFRRSRGIDATRAFNASEREAFEGNRPLNPAEVRVPTTPGAPSGLPDARYSSDPRYPSGAPHPSSVPAGQPDTRYPSGQSTAPGVADARYPTQPNQPVRPHYQTEPAMATPYPAGHTDAQFRAAHGIDATRALTAQEQAQFEAQRKNPAPAPAVHPVPAVAV